MKRAVVWNSGAGSAGDASAEDVVRRLEEALGGTVDLYRVGEARDPRASAREAVAAGAEIVIAAGGDGTVSAVATELVGTGAALGVLPLGTSNSFAAALESGDDLEAAIATLAAGNRRVVDAAIVASETERRMMILHCMIGLHATAIEDTSAQDKRRWGVLAYAMSAIRCLANLEPFDVELDTGEHRVSCRAIAIAAANVAPAKTVLAHGPSHLLGDDGRVDVTIVAADTMGEALATGLHLYRSARSAEPAMRDNVGSFSTPRVTVRAAPAQRVVVDGEPFGDTPITIETLAGALTVIAPAAGIPKGDPIEAPLSGLPELEIDGTKVD